MNKLLSSVGLAILVATASLAGCQLYFGDRDDDDVHGNPPGYKCNNDLQCAAGCYCADDGVCEEAGFCLTDKECGTGFICDKARSSCKPAPACTRDDQCEAGSICDPGVRACVVTCKCTTDAEAVAQGAGWCDEGRGTCMKGADPAGACLGEVTCDVDGPKCAAGEVPLVKDGCYTGSCRAITACEGAPVCGSLQHDADCKARSTDCSPVYIGRDCTGTTCGVSPDDCRCAQYLFNECEVKVTPQPRVVVD